MASRVTAHKVETKTKNKIRTIVDEHDALFRDIGEKDYGIDGVIEFFDEGAITGKFVFVQIKGTASEIKKMKTKDSISCEIQTTSARYANQKHAVVLLIYSSTINHDEFYYLELSGLSFDENKILNQKSITVHIPLQNRAKGNIDGINEIVEKFYRS